MIQKNLDATAHSAAARYQTMLFALRGSMSKILNQGYPIKINELQKALKNIIDTHIESEVMLLKGELERIARMALITFEGDSGQRNSSDLKSHIVDHLDALGDDLINDLSLQAVRDARAIISKVRQMKLEINMHSGTKQEALSAVRDAHKDDFTFQFRDRRNRRWKSHNYIRSLVRSYLLMIYNETYLYVASLWGYDEAVVRHREVNHAKNGIRFSIVEENSKLPSYAEIKDEIFHPNSGSYVSI